MKKNPVIGITAEWNPFHSGHAAMIKEIRKSFPDARIISAMSGSFVQRGEPAIFDKWSRASWSISSGVDAVFEYPALYVLQSADSFSENAVHLLHDLGCTHIAFSTESLDKNQLFDIARWMQTEDYTARLHQELKNGLPYSRAASAAINSFSNKLYQELIKPNNLLGLRYVETVPKYYPDLEVFITHRDMEHNISASDARAQLLETGSSLLLPPNIQEEAEILMQSGNYTDFNRYEDACLFMSKALGLSDLSDSGLFTEGLENKWKKEAEKTTFPQMLSGIKSKRYLYSKLKRISASLLLSGTKKPSPFVKPDFPRYARLLALRQESSELIHHITIPVITSAAKAMRTLDEKSREALSIDFLATDIQAYCRHSDRYRYSNEDYYHSPEILK